MLYFCVTSKTYPITPVSKPRMTRSDKWKKRKCVLKYYEFKDQCNSHEMDIPESDASIVFVIPMSKSWSKKKRSEMNGQPHQQRPDVDNLLKAVFDAVHSEDCHIWDIRATKVWGEKGEITVNTGDPLSSR